MNIYISKKNCFIRFGKLAKVFFDLSIITDGKNLSIN